MMPLQKIKEVHPLLCKFSIEAVGFILHYGSLIPLLPDQILYKRNELDLKVYMIIYGTVELLKTDEQETNA